MLAANNTTEEDHSEELELLRSVAGRIRMARLNAKLTQQDVAERTGLKRAYVYELERGTANPTLRTLSKVAQALVLAPADLLPQSDHPRLCRHDVEALLAALESLAQQVQGEQERAANSAAEALKGFRSFLIRMLPLSPDDTTEGRPDDLPGSPHRNL